MISFIDVFKDQFGVEPICVTLGATEGGFITSRGYRAAKRRPASARRVRDELLIGEVARLHEVNYSVYGVRKMHAAMRRAGWEIGRDQVARLMRKAGLRGMTRGKTVRTTVPSKLDMKFPDLVKRNFTATRPNQLWVATLRLFPRGLALPTWPLSPMCIAGKLLAGMCHHDSRLKLYPCKHLTWPHGSPKEI